MDTIEKIERDFVDNIDPSGRDADRYLMVTVRNKEWLQLRILIEIAYQLRVLAQKGAG